MATFMYNFIEKLNVAAKMDEDLNRAMEPAIEKLKMLPEVWNVLHKYPMQIKFLDCGGLSSFVNWLVPLPDGSLPNTNVQTTVLTLLADFPIDVASNKRREQLKSSGIGKVVMALTRLPQETPANQKLARDLVNKWSRPLFDNRISYDHIRRPYRAEPVPQPSQPESMATKKLAPVKRTTADRGDDLDVHQGSKKLKQASADKGDDLDVLQGSKKLKQASADKGDDLDVHQGSKKLKQAGEGCKLQVEKNTGNGRASKIWSRDRRRS